MLKRKTRIRPIDDARTHILSLRDKPGFMERFIDSNKGMGLHTTHEYLSNVTVRLHTLT